MNVKTSNSTMASKCHLSDWECFSHHQRRPKQLLRQHYGLVIATSTQRRPMAMSDKSAKASARRELTAQKYLLKQKSGSPIMDTTKRCTHSRRQLKSLVLYYRLAYFASTKCRGI